MPEEIPKHRERKEWNNRIDEEEASHMKNEAAARQKGQAANSAHRVELDEKTNQLLDEIDEILEVNAEDFVLGYIQKGGQ